MHLTGGATNTGTVEVQGESAVPGTSTYTVTPETLTFTGAGFRRTVRRFRSITGFVTAGLADEVLVPTMTVKLKGSDNASLQALTTLTIGYPAQVDEFNSDWRAHEAAGRGQMGGPRIVIPWTDLWEPRVGDLITDDQGKTWEVQGKPATGGDLTDRHWWCKVSRWEQAP